MIIDAHQHLWDLERVWYPWLGPSSRPIHRSFRVADAEPLLAAAGVDRTVLVQSMNSVEDTRYLLEVADTWPRVAGVVGWVPLAEPVIAAAALDHFATDPRFVGVRHLIHEEPDPDWLVRPPVLEGLSLLAERGLTFDVVAVDPRHLAHVATVARLLPGLRIVVDHLAKPPVRQRGWQPWADLLAEAAAYPGVSAKLSGLNTAADWNDWSAAELEPYVTYALELFGAERLMYGGDWPVSVLAGGYEAVWRETGRLLDGLDPVRRDRILGGTAVEVYRLPVGLP